MLVLHTQKHIKVIGYHEKGCSFSRDERLVLVMGFSIPIHIEKGTQVIIAEDAGKALD